MPVLAAFRARACSGCGSENAPLTSYQRVIVTVVNKDEETGQVGGTVPATLSLALGTPASFGAFTPGVARDYTANTSATVISTAWL